MHTVDQDLERWPCWRPQEKLSHPINRTYQILTQIINTMMICQVSLFWLFHKFVYVILKNVQELLKKSLAHNIFGTGTHTN